MKMMVILRYFHVVVVVVGRVVCWLIDGSLLDYLPPMFSCFCACACACCCCASCDDFLLRVVVRVYWSSHSFQLQRRKGELCTGWWDWWDWLKVRAGFVKSFCFCFLYGSRKQLAE